MNQSIDVCGAIWRHSHRLFGSKIAPFNSAHVGKRYDINNK